jgi:hypothetical protein
MVQENEAKLRAKIILIVVNDETRAIASLVEAAELITGGRTVALLIKDFEPGATMPKVEGLDDNGLPIKIDTVQRADLNRGRAYLADVAARRGLKIFTKIEAVVQHVVELCQRLAVYEHDGSDGTNSSVRSV